MNTVPTFSTWLLEAEEQPYEHANETAKKLNALGVGPVFRITEVKYSIPCYFIMYKNIQNPDFERFRTIAKSKPSHFYCPFYSKGKVYGFVFEKDMLETVKEYGKKEDFATYGHSDDMFVSPDTVRTIFKIVSKLYSGPDEVSGVISTNRITESMEMKLFVDDERNPSDCIYLMKDKLGEKVKVYSEPSWNIVRTYGDFKRWIDEAEELPTLVSLDNDIAPPQSVREQIPIEDWFDLAENREYEGIDCLKLMINYCLDHDCDLPEILVHTQNPVAQENMTKDIKRFKRYRDDGR